MKNQKEYQKEYQRRLRKQVLDLLGNQCARCEISDPRVLQIDYVNGGGNQYGKNTSWLQKQKDILRNPSEFQILCANCNLIKRAECGEVRGANKIFKPERDEMDSMICCPDYPNCLRHRG